MEKECPNNIHNCILNDEERQRKVILLDLTNRGLSVFHEDYLLIYQNVQYLYLEGNSLKEISKDFFPSLKQLKWLDIRNNKLTTVPESVVDHSSLQVLLLDGNNIERLPIELGSLSSLRGLQVSKNPIVFPPLNIINQGVQSTIDFLRKQWQQYHTPQQIQLISETHSQSYPQRKSKSSIKEKKTGACKSAVTQQVNILKLCKPRKVQSGMCSNSLNNCIRVHPINHQNQQANLNMSVNNWINDSMNYSQKQTNNIQIIERTCQDKIKRNEEEKSSLLRDLWLEKIRQILITQESILQRRRNIEALKQWQSETKKIQLMLSNKRTDGDICFPYDTHPQYLKMLSRQQLLDDREKILVDPSQRNSKPDESINCSIISIMAALQEVQESKSKTKVSPRSEQQILVYEMKKIKDIQRSLNALKLKNFGQLNIN